MSELIKNETRLQRIFRETVVLALLVIGILAARSTLADHYYVPSGSMEFTLISGDRVFVDKRAYGIRIPFTDIQLTNGDAVRRGDIVIFDSPRDDKRLIIRIVEVAGVDVLLKDGHLAINGEWLGSPENSAIELMGEKVVQLNLAHGGGRAFAGTIEDGMVLAIGDHRGNSVDGRIFGAVNEDEIYGRAIAIYYRRESGFGWREL
jgi:signal peptidase I